MSKSYIEEERKFIGQYGAEVLQALFFGYQKRVKTVLLLLLIGFIGRAFLIANASLVGIWVDTACRGEFCRPRSGLFSDFEHWDFVFLLAGVSVVGFVLTLVFRIFFSHLSARVVSQLYDEVTYRTSRFPQSFFDRTPVGRVVTRFSSDYGNLFRLIGGPLADFISTFFDLLAMILLIAFTQPLYAPVLALIIGLNYFIYRSNVNDLRLQRRNLSRARSPSISHFTETVQGASTIRAYGREADFFRQFEKKDLAYQDQRLKMLRTSATFNLQMSLSTAALFLATALTGWWMIQSGRGSVGGLGAALALVMLSSASIQTFFEWLASFEDALSGLERLNEYLRRPIEKGAFLPTQAQFPTNHLREPMTHDRDATKLERAVSVKLQNVSMGYIKEDGDIVHDVSLHIKAGERVGIVGRTGSGKTSLIQALFCLYPLSAGTIEIGDDVVSTDKTTDLKSWRSRIGLISQDPVLFAGTLRDNLDLLGKDSNEEIRAVLAQVGLEKWMTEQARGLDFSVQDRGRNLSMGERQLICIARCLLQKTPVVIMDEATSSIDPQTEGIMARAAEVLFAGRTQIVIAHRLSTLRNCDRVVWLERGRVRQIGTPEVIIHKFTSDQLSSDSAT